MDNLTLRDVLVDEMKDLLDAENQLVDALPKVAKACQSEELRRGVEEHLEQTKGHVRRLEQAFTLLGMEPKSETCKAMKGLIAEGERAIKDGKDLAAGPADIDIIIAAQKIEHYEISGYGSLRAVAEKLGETQVARLLADTLAEEKKCDELLTSITQTLFAKAA